MTRIAIAMSGGVDSSVAAALLQREGADVFGITMRLGLAEAEGRPCCGEEEVLLAARVAGQLGIPHVVIDMAEVFTEEVVRPTAEAYAAGHTPNPCVLCNERVKFKALIERARALGADSLATGHYARVAIDADGSAWLEQARDSAKDQSYFLYRIPQSTLPFLRFPLGELAKAEVREIAESFGLPTARRPDSQEVCFDRSIAAEVLGLTSGSEPGPIEDTDGRVLGAHHGIAGYTVGQRKGLGLDGPDGPRFVTRIDAARNTVVVATGRTETTAVRLADAVWRPEVTLRARARLRYRGPLHEATVTPDESGLTICFDQPVPAPAPGQSAVLYSGQRVLGGGIISGWHTESDSGTVAETATANTEQ